MKKTNDVPAQIKLFLVLLVESVDGALNPSYFDFLHKLMFSKKDVACIK